MEGQRHDVDPGDLRDGDAVRCRERGVEDALSSRDDFVQGSEAVD